ncbi:DUF6493 family protein [Streptomyces sp. NPDC008343]|uniref:DUF7824 domain-containing protein n=1 Tax=Streptomyces sp. NPDC008343 TaxID=3364828 RepID=UPI0036EF675D
MDDWIEVIREKDSAHARTVTTALKALKGDPRCVSDEQLESLLRFVATGPVSKACAAVACLKSFADAGRLTVDQVGECARETLFRPEKSLVNSMIAFLGQVLRKDPGCTEVLVPLLADAFGHTSVDVQEKALALAEKHADRLDAAARQSFAAAAEQLIPALRARAWAVFGDDGHSSPSVGPEESYEVPLPPAPAPVHVAPPVDSAAGAVEELAVVLRARTPDPVRGERVWDALVRCAHRDRAGFAAALGPLLKSCGWVPSDTGDGLAKGGKPLLAAVALMDSVGPGRPGGGVTDEVIAANDNLLTDAHIRWTGRGKPCGHTVFDQVLHARWNEVIRRLRDHVTTPLLLATPTWTNGAISPTDLVERLAAYHRLQAQPGRADLEQALLRVRHDTDADRAAAAAEALGTPEALRLAGWLRRGGLTLPETVRTPLEAQEPDNAIDPSDSQPWRLRTAVPAFTDRLDGFSKPFQDLAGPYLADRDHCGIWNSEGAWPHMMPLWLMVLPRHREIVAARTLTAYAEGAETPRRSAAVHLPALAESEGVVGTAVRLALVYGLGANRAGERVAASDAFLALAASGDLGEEQLGRDVADLVTGRNLKVTRLTESLSMAAQGGAHHAVAVVLASALSGLLTTGATAPASLAKLLTVAAECAERSRRPLPPVDGLAELAARPGSGLVVKSARRLRDAVTQAAPA